MGPREYVKKWIDRHAVDEDLGHGQVLAPHTTRTRTSDEVERPSIAAPAEERCGPDALDPKVRCSGADLTQRSHRSTARCERDDPASLRTSA